MSGEFEEKFIKPIINASYPGTLAALSLTVLSVGGMEDISIGLKFALLSGATLFLLSSFFIFFYSIYPTRRKLWTGAALTFLMGLSSSFVSVFFLLIP